MRPDEAASSPDRKPAQPEASSGPGVLALAGAYTLHGLTFLVWDVPVFILYRVPRFVFWDAPSYVVTTLRTDRSRIESLISELDSETPPSPDRAREIFSELEDLTGVAFADKGEWLAWWSENRDRPRESWHRAWVEAALALLGSQSYWDRMTGADRLRRASGIDAGYDPKAPAAEREQSAQAWRTWWARERQGDSKR